MDVKNLVMAVVSMVLAAVMIGGALLPSVASAVDDQRTIVNNTASGKFSNFYGENLDNLVAEIKLNDYSELGFNVTINGSSYFVGATARESMVMSDKMFIRADPRNSGASISYASMTSNSDLITSITLPLVVTISGNTINVKDSGTVDITESNNNWVFIPDSNGNYELVANDSTVPIYLNNSDQVYISTYIITNNLGWVSGYGSNLEFVNSGVKTNLILTDFEEDSRYNDLIVGLAGNVDINPEVGTNSDGTNFTPFFIMIPRSVNAHTVQNDIITSLFNVVPIIGIAGLVMAGIYVFISRK